MIWNCEEKYSHTNPDSVHLKGQHTLNIWVWILIWWYTVYIVILFMVMNSYLTFIEYDFSRMRLSSRRLRIEVGNESRFHREARLCPHSHVQDECDECRDCPLTQPETHVYRVLHTPVGAADNGLTGDFRLASSHWNTMARLSWHAKYPNPLQLHG